MKFYSANKNLLNLMAPGHVDDLGHLHNSIYFEEISWQWI